MPKPSPRVKKAKTLKKLTLAKETFANLAPPDPKAVRGGMRPPTDTITTMTRCRAGC